jgi:hypothetical protein
MEEDVIDKYHKQKMIDEMAGVIKGVKEKLDSCEHGKAMKTVPLRPNWIAIHDEFSALVDQLEEIKNKTESKHKLLWGTIEGDLDEYGRHMHIDRKKGEVIIYDKEQDES